MKKKVLPVIIAMCLLAGILVGCGQTEDTVNDVNTSVEVEASVEDGNVETSEENSDVATEVEENEAVSEAEQEVNDDAAQICSRCQREVVCGTYEVDGEVFILCDSCLVNLLMNMITHQSADFARAKRFAVTMK